MSPEFLWHESDFVNNVLVLNNTINSYSGGMQLGTEASVRAITLLEYHSWSIYFFPGSIPAWQIFAVLWDGAPPFLVSVLRDAFTRCCGLTSGTHLSGCSKR